MMKRYAVIVCAVCFLTGAVSLNVAAQSSSDDKNIRQEKSEHKECGPCARMKEHRRKKGEKSGEMFKELGLTEEQQTKIEEHKKVTMEAAKVLREQIRLKKEAIGAELQKEQLDMDTINALQTEIKTLIAQREDNRLKGILEMRGILTSEQFQKFHQRMKAHGSKFKEGRHPMPEDK